MLMMPIVEAAAASPGGARFSLDSILRSVRTHLGMQVGFISEFTDGRRVFRHVEAAEGSACIEVGGSDPLEESYCHWIVQGRLPRLIRDPHDHPFTAELVATDALPVGAHLSVPIMLRDGTIYGTFCCFSFQSDQTLTERDLATMEAFAQLAGEQIQSALDSGRARETKVAKVGGIIARRDLQMVLQPVISIESRRVQFVEALARFYSKPYQSPDRWFAAAAEVGLRTELELLAAEQALEALAELPPDASISINVSPETIMSAEFQASFTFAPLKRIILEITEHDAIAGYARVIEALKPLRTRGMRVAVDDTGAGYSSFRHILQIQPDIIKLDMSLVRGIDHDPALRALASALVGFSCEIGTILVAEGIETETELATLRELKIEFAQGYLLSEPLSPVAAAEFIAGAPKLPLSLGPTGAASTVQQAG